MQATASLLASSREEATFPDCPDKWRLWTSTTGAEHRQQRRQGGKGVTSHPGRLEKSEIGDLSISLNNVTHKPRLASPGSGRPSSDSGSRRYCWADPRDQGSAVADRQWTRAKKPCLLGILGRKFPMR